MRTVSHESPPPPLLPGPGASSDPGLDVADQEVGRRAIGSGQLGRTARSGVLWTMGGQWSGYMLQIVTTIVLSRLLTPFQVGLFGLALTMTVFAQQFGNLGLSQAVIQRETITQRQLNALFWVNAGAGVVLAVVVAALAPVLAWFYGEPLLTPITAGLAVTYLITGLAVQPSALLARQLSFKALALRTSVARFVAAVAAIVAAVAGAGAWSLVVQQIALAAATCVMVWIAVDWRPSRPGGLREALPLIRFGAGFTTGEILNTLSRNADNILIGRFVGAAALGFYTRAYALLMLPVRQLKTPLGTALQPMLAALRTEPVRYRRLYCGAISGLCHLGMPALALLAVPAYQLIHTLLGARWVPAAGIFQFLAVAGIVQMVSSTAGWLLVTMGDAGRYAKMSLWGGVATVASFLVGLPWQAQGVAAAYAVGQVLMTPVLFWYCCRHSPVSTGDVARAMWRPLVVTAVVALVGWATLRLTDHGVLAYWGQLIAVWLVAGSLWLASLWFWRSARQEVLLLVNGMRGRRSRPPKAAV